MKQVQICKQGLKLMLIATMLVMACPKVNAQQLNFVRVTADALNIRKSPSTQAARLMRFNEDGTDWVFYDWSDSKHEQKMLTSAYHPQKGQILAKLKSANGWTQVMLSYTSEAGDHVGWVSSQYVQDVEPVILTDEQYYSSSGPTIREKGTTKGWILEYPDDMNGDSRLRIFRDGTMINYDIYQLNIEETDTPGAKFELNRRMEWGVCWLLKLGPNRRNAEGYYFDLNKFTDAEMEQIIKAVTSDRQTKKSITYFFDNVNYGKNEWEGRYSGFTYLLNNR